MTMPTTPTTKTFDWHHSSDLETLWVVGEDIGFFQALPGHPFELTEPSRPGQLPCDLTVMVGDLGARVRYRLARRPSGPDDAGVLAQALAYTYPKVRSPEPGDPRSAPPEQLARFGADGAASILYRLADGIEPGFDTEETLALVKGDRVVVITKTFAGAKTDPIAWALFNQASAQSIVWDPARRPAVASVWPPGVFLAPGVHGAARSEPRAALRAALDASAAGSGDRRALADALRRLFGGSEPLAEPVTAEMKKTYADYLKTACDDRALWGAIDAGLALVENAYDLHGLAIVLWRELTSG
jgi:hypothetical protein